MNSQLILQSQKHALEKFRSELMENLPPEDSPLEDCKCGCVESQTRSREVSDTDTTIQFEDSPIQGCCVQNKPIDQIQSETESEEDSLVYRLRPMRSQQNNSPQILNKIIPPKILIQN